MPGGIHPANLANKLLDHALGGPDYTRLATVYPALFTTIPAADGTGAVEASGGGYGRLTTTNNETNFPAAASAAKKNGAALTWSAFSAALGVLAGIGLYDASTAGKLIAWALLNSSVSGASGQGFEVPANGLAFTLTGDLHPTNLANKLLDHALGGSDYTRLATVYPGLFTTMPGADGTGFVEASGGGYGRLTVTNNSTNFPAAASGQKKNGTAWTWSAFSAALGAILGVGLFDAATEGNLIAWAPLNSSVYVASGQGFEAPANGLVFNLKSQGA
jgi:hypothetical protein